MKKIYKKSAAALAALMLASTIMPVTNIYAAENEQEINTKVEKRILSEQEISIADKYISFNTNTNTFELSSNILHEVSKSQYENILEQVNNTNELITTAIHDESDDLVVDVIDSDGDRIALKEVYIRGRGVNKVEFYWNYARIFIDAGNVSLALQVGFVIGTVYAPAKIVQAVCGILGIASGNINHGIWFDYNYFIGVLCGNAGLQ